MIHDLKKYNLYLTQTNNLKNLFQQRIDKTKQKKLN